MCPAFKHSALAIPINCRIFFFASNAGATHNKTNEKRMRIRNKIQLRWHIPPVYSKIWRQIPGSWRDDVRCLMNGPLPTDSSRIFTLGLIKVLQNIAVLLKSYQVAITDQCTVHFILTYEQYWIIIFKCKFM